MHIPWMIWQASLSVITLAAAGGLWGWIAGEDPKIPQIGQSRAQAEQALGGYAFFGKTCFGELAVFTDRQQNGHEEHVMAFLDKSGQTVIATEVQTEETEVASTSSCRQMVQDRLSAGAPIGEYPAGAKHRFFARLKLPGGNWHEVWADYQSDGSKQTCEVFNRRSGPGEQRLSPQGEWLLPGTAANVAFDAFTATPAEKKPGS